MFPEPADAERRDSFADARLVVSPPRARRILVTGIGRFWGANLVRMLEKDHSIDFIVGVDTRPPQGEFGRAEVVRADIRNPAIQKLIDVTKVDTVVHTQIYGADRPGESGRMLHDMNVIGTMNLLAACASTPSIRKLVLRSSSAIYGASRRDPAFFTEPMEARSRLRDQYARDIAEVEAYALDYAERAPHACVTILRFANSLGEVVDTALTRYLSSQVVPVYAGYNPRLQFIHDADAVAALAHAVREWRPGIVNVAGPGTITLRRFLRLAGRIPAPILPPAMGLAFDVLSRAGVLYVPREYHDFLRYGRGVDTHRMLDQFGFMPEYTTAEAAEAFAAFTRVRRYHAQAQQPALDQELFDYVQRKMAGMPPLAGDMLSRWMAATPAATAVASDDDADDPFAP